MIKIFLLSLFVSLSVFAGGTDIVYGGDEILAAFKKIQLDLKKDIALVPIKYLPGDNYFLTDYNNIAANTELVVVDHLYKDGQEIGFLNYPLRKPTRIEISRKLWNCMDTTKESCRQLVLHEMLHLLDINDRTYYHSSQVLELINYFKSLDSIPALIRPAKGGTSEALPFAFYWIIERINFPEKLMPYVDINNISIKNSDKYQLEWLRSYFLSKDSVQAFGYNNY